MCTIPVLYIGLGEIIGTGKGLTISKHVEANTNVYGRIKRMHLSASKIHK